jgi:hypothetical protein
MGYRNYATAQGHIVDATGKGDFTTIQAAINAATTFDTIFIRPGTYTGNVTLQPNINLVAFETDAYSANVVISGAISYSSTGDVSISGIQLQASGGYSLTVSGSNTSGVTLINCYLIGENHTFLNFTSSSSSSFIYIIDCICDMLNAGSSLFASTSAGTMILDNVIGLNTYGTAVSNTFNNSSGFLKIQNCVMKYPFTLTAGSINAITSSWIDCGASNTTALTISGGAAQVYQSTFSSGSATAITVAGTLDFYNGNVYSTATDAITGAGIISYGGIVFSGSTNIITTSTQSPVPYTVQQGGTDASSFTAYAPVCGGTTSTGALQSTASAGSSGQVLTSNGSSSLPTFQAVPNGLVYISEQTASNSTSIAFTSGLTSYTALMLVFSGVVPATNNAQLELQMSANGGSSYVSSGYTGGFNYFEYNSSTTYNASSTSFWPMAGDQNSSTGTINGVIFIHNVNIAVAPFINGNVSYYDGGKSQYCMGIVGGSCTTTGLNAISLLMSSGNISSGRFVLYGLQNS